MRTALMIYDGDEYNEVYQTETDAVPRAGEFVEIRDAHGDMTISHFVDKVVWVYSQDGRMPQAYVYLRK